MKPDREKYFAEQRARMDAERRRVRKAAPLTAREKAAAVRLMDRGMDRREVAEILGTHYTTVASIDWAIRRAK